MESSDTLKVCILFSVRMKVPVFNLILRIRKEQFFSLSRILRIEKVGQNNDERADF